jgi:hypothetical protein
MCRLAILVLPLQSLCTVFPFVVLKGHDILPETIRNTLCAWDIFLYFYQKIMMLEAAIRASVGPLELPQGGLALTTLLICSNDCTNNRIRYIECMQIRNDGTTLVELPPKMATRRLVSSSSEHTTMEAHIATFGFEMPPKIW